MESKLYKRVKENLPNCTINKLENRGFLGIPDLLIGFSGLKFVLIELKVVEKGKKNTIFSAPNCISTET